MVQMCLLVAVESPGCSGFGAEPKNEILGFCEERLVASYVAGLQEHRDRRLWSSSYILSIQVPSSGVVDLKLDLDMLDADQGVSYIPLR